MLEKYVKAGDKVEILPLHRVSLKEEEKQEQRIYISKINQILDEDKLEILMPIEQSKIVLLPRNVVLNLVIYTSNGLYQCEVKATERYKSGNIFLQAMELIGPMKRYQRREFYRYSCAVTVFSRSLLEEEKENLIWDDTIPGIEGTSFDIGGGGIRFRVDHEFEKDEMILCIIHLDVKGMAREIQTLGKVLSVKPIKNSEAFEVRVQFERITHKDRELIIQYIFEDERKRRKHDSGL
ncbi:MAG: PilZ domain-containing protein [Lachnospiraceae bacterium]|nr:PilZ domain-containing protein [Lachnospiraceae bacterium]